VSFTVGSGHRWNNDPTPLSCHKAGGRAHCPVALLGEGLVCPVQGSPGLLVEGAWPGRATPN